ncbi:MAG: repressor in the phenylacetic acid catabolism [Candidatus Yanofskybacteria bacterium GW2011_GWA2_41_22]|uniref:CRISPR-associated endonuclease Cas2 n=4 Tax=Candidatus Yanofskyibacteriota TaxID=1752733 RepID=A0A1F8HQE5_9BACT|nr:MAG: repressor in the phenylacetic acid catabolism [Candidatus Yanofskybacteria bacterium GW2011_GWA2_41_22]KKS27058.1 MAG: repressor in the phenylacetic acid catabolism [Candidatus Yanofskybacteria bacterium GW2011_GWC2_41_9]OGM99112.1 MAG: CRISPR-associated endonuclease Cas2 [Candidatus Yanofskybacteria bacterium RIFCSPHIGHO2_01_FULL_41_27]OGN09519.1 MAG: CRISPR-associated endonuclease Cas2 [Candidatus Yanofskybacteria bacterium RIFCSPHIGHO2_02_FULL_41_12]OGN20589.1 MAG: CRISPR-associated 
MKEKFIIRFLEELISAFGELSRSLGRVSYKGFRYNDFSIDLSDDSKKYFGFKNLERRGIIRRKNSDEFIFTKNGQKWFQESHTRYFKNKNNGKWDGKWRVIIFDIPQELHNERIRFRKKIKSLGFVMLQKSVFIFPYPCDDEIGDICGNLNISDFVDIIVAESPGFREAELRKIFNLAGWES